MELGTARWDQRRGWVQPLPDLDGPGTLVLAFGDSSLRDDPAPLNDVLAAFPSSVVTGCSTAGEILGDTVSDGAVTVVAARFAATRLVTATESVPNPEGSLDAAKRLGERLVAHADGLELPLAAVLTFSDGLTVNGSAVASGLVEGTHGRVPISGGLAGDDDRFQRTWVLAGGELLQGHLTAVGLAGSSLRVGHGSRGGWDPFGPVRTVTRSEGNVLLELDGQPALDLYEHYLGERAAGLPATALLFPLALRMPHARDREVVRTVLSVDPQARSMTFAGDVPEGSSAQLMTGTLDRLIRGAGEAADRAIAPDERPEAADGPTLAVAVSCVGRRLVLGRRTEDELEAVLDRLPGGSELVGFYSYGEISPIGAGACDLHNQTMTVTTLAEAG
jgi:hypothetical protein